MASKGAFSFQLSGVKELTKLLDQLPTVAMRKTVIRNALKKAGQPIAEAAKANAPVVTGKLRDSIKVSTSLIASQRKGRQNRSVVTVYVGSSSPLAHLVEFGTVERILKEPRQVFFNGRWAVIRTTGYTPPNPFLRTAWDSTKRVALKVFAEEMEQQIYKAARRLRKRAEKGTLTKRQVEGLMR